MALLTGEITDISQRSIADLDLEIWFELNRSTQHENRLITRHPVRATVQGAAWSVNLEPTFSGDYYTILLVYVDPWSREMRYRDVLPQRVLVPEEGGTLGGLPSAVMSPDTVIVQATEPARQSGFWLDATIGDPDPGVSTGSGDFYVWRD